MKNRLLFIARVLISLSLIGVLLWLMRKDIPDIIKAIRNANIKFLLLGCSAYFIATIMLGFRLTKVMSVQGIKLSYKESIYLTLIGYFFNNFLPTTFGGDLPKAYYIGKKSNKKAAAFAGVFMDRVLAMFPFTAIPALTLLFYQQRMSNKGLVLAAYLLFGGCLLFLAFILNKSAVRYAAAVLAPFKKSSFYKKIKDGYNFLNIYSKHKIVLVWSFTLSVIIQVISIISVYLLSKAIGVDNVALGVFFVVFPIIGIMSMLPSMNGLGIREGGFVYLFKGYMQPEQAFATAVLVLLSITAVGVLGGIIYAFKKSLFDFKAEELE